MADLSCQLSNKQQTHEVQNNSQQPHALSHFSDPHVAPAALLHNSAGPC
eukprot:CAMPEP_0202912190 /NCGR_PEP_ID=MMETSP1392-20130828/57048_1 /ASSEMBLY_ACC=CAM_ASM_000868 /TAXON_ID=225041 /ORGANISM="Chlamydomonas chlamydogama, Strain SAG 11-48b" /LENGTH=48 /DNA_ID= /DNA_START= /DNA_END= /DNA_ORIENTATION=